MAGLDRRACAGLPTLARRFHPVATFVASLVLSVVCAVGGGAEVTYLAVVLPLHMVAAEAPRRHSLPALGAALALALGVNIVPSRPWALAGIVLGWTLFGAAWMLGRAGRERRHYAVLTAERHARDAVVEERLRIARELHDVVAHSMSLIAVKAGVAHHIATQRPDEARAALGVIETTTREALVEMRQLLGVLRSTRDTTPELAPSPGLAGLSELTTRARAGGVEAELTVDVPVALPEGVELSVFRIVQEALTNVVKHAAPARCRVRVAADAESVEIEVADDGPGGDSGEGGHGLVGMRERTAVHGGTFDAGPRPEGGFAVRAVLPYG
ncbi:sensor histidine kinase [Prauserella oleivorans]